MAVVMPIISPRRFRSGPPELPGLIAASVWMMPRISRLFSERNERFRLLMMPVVSVRSRPNGLPMAKTRRPTSSFDESPQGSGTSFSAGASIFSTARSLFGSAPTSLASWVLLSKRVTTVWWASSMTW